MTAAWLTLFFLLGVAVGSFLNVVADRLPAGKSIVSPPSHCPECQRRLSAKDMVPLFSYLWLKGHCRYCDANIPMRLFWVELGMGILFAFLYWHYGLGWELAMVAFYCCLFVALLATDLEHRILPNKIVYPGIVVALIVASLGSIFGSEPTGGIGLSFGPWIVNSLVGGAIFSGLLFILALIYAALGRGAGMGLGDVKLAGLIGLITGFPLVLISMYLSILSGGLVAIVLLLLRLKGRKEAMPFGPFLSLAAMATLFWGSGLLNWLGFS